MSKEILHIYTRVSTSGQEEKGESLEFQTKLGEEKSKQLGMDLKVWNEGGVSSNIDDIGSRPVLMNMMNSIEDGTIKYLWCFEQSRLMRTDLVRYQTTMMLKKYKVTLYVRDTLYDLNDPATEFMFTVMGGMSKLENQLRVERSRQGKLLKIKKGGWKGGVVNFGYKIVDKMVTVDEFESGWVKKVFELYSKGKSLLHIKNLLDLNNIPTRYGKGEKTWTLGSIRKILGNTFYIGYYNYVDKKSGQTFKCDVPPIVDSTLYNKVQTKFSKFERTYKNQFNTTRNFYLLRDKMMCSCGEKIYGLIRRSDDPTRKRNIYFCNHRNKKYKENKLDPNQKYKRGLFCTNYKSMNITVTDEVVWETILDCIRNSYILKEDFKDGIVKPIQERRTGNSKKKEELERSKTVNKRKIVKTNEMIDLLESEMIMNRGSIKIKGVQVSNPKQVLKIQKEELNRLLVTEKELTTQIDEETDNTDYVNWLEKFNVKYGDKDSFDDKEKKDIIDRLVEVIKVSFNETTQLHKLDIIFNLPIIGDSRFKNDEKKWVVEGGKSKRIIKDIKLFNIGRRVKKKLNLEVNQKHPKRFHSVTVE